MVIGRGALSALGVAALIAAGSAHAQAAHVGVSFNDMVGYDSGPNAANQGLNAYTPNSGVGEIGSGYYRGQYEAREGSGRADFGSLSLSTFLASESDGHGEPIVRLDELVKTYWHDQFTVTSDTLAAGTTVRLTMRALVDIPTYGHIDTVWPDGYGGGCMTTPNQFVTGGCMGVGSTTSSGATGGFAVDGWTYAGDPSRDYAVWGDLSFGLNAITFTKDVTVGSTFDVNVRMEAVASQYNPFTYLSGFGGSAFFMTATSRLEQSDAFAVSTASGTNYSLAAEVSDVPEPASWAMMLLGFGFVGAALRRRGASVSGLAQG